MTALQKKIVVDERGEPVEVILPWAQFCEIAEALGFNLDAEALKNLREAKCDWDSGERGEFVRLSEL